MADEKGIVQYQASDGSSVKLSPAIVARYIVTGGAQASDREVYAFMAKCQARHLNPLAGDAYMTVYNSKQGPQASVIVSKDYFVRTATQQDSFDGLRAGVVVANKHTGELAYREGCIVGSNSEDLVGGWAEVLVKGRSVPSRAEVSLAEYDQHRSLWTSKPATMIRKVALVQALREAYPGAYGGIYDRDEMDVPEGLTPPAVEPQAAPQPAQVTPPTPAEVPADVNPETGEVTEPELYGEDVEF